MLKTYFSASYPFVGGWKDLRNFVPVGGTANYMIYYDSILGYNRKVKLKFLHL